MTHLEVIQALRSLSAETGSLLCLGCEYEHNCGIHGCAIMRTSADLLEQLTAEPPNEPLTLEELRGMDGEPVYIVEHPDWGHWELSEYAEDYFDDRDEDFYGMTMPPTLPDPMGRYGLHVLGWLCPECGNTLKSQTAGHYIDLDWKDDDDA